MNKEVVGIVLRPHGEALYGLDRRPHRAYAPCEHFESPNPPVTFTKVVVQKLVELCPRLEYLEILIPRTRGDDQEVGIHHALSKLPRLRRLFLKLGYWIRSDDELWDEERDGEHPLVDCEELHDFPRAILREAFTNGALHIQIDIRRWKHEVYEANHQSKDDSCFTREIRS
jgi:hypothetical protein